MKTKGPLKRGGRSAGRRKARALLHFRGGFSERDRAREKNARFCGNLRGKDRTAFDKGNRDLSSRLFPLCFPLSRHRSPAAGPEASPEGLASGPASLPTDCREFTPNSYPVSGLPERAECPDRSSYPKACAPTTAPPPFCSGGAGVPTPPHERKTAYRIPSPLGAD